MAEVFVPLTATGLDGSIIGVINTNFATLATLLADVHSRSGVTPNQMLAPLDMNNNFIINLPIIPTNNAHAASKFYVDTSIGTALTSLLPQTFLPYLQIGINPPTWYVQAGISLGTFPIPLVPPGLGVLSASTGVVVGSLTQLLATGAILPAIQTQGTTTSSAAASNTKWSADSTGPQNFLLKSRGATIGTHAAVINGDVTGALIFAADDGSVFRNAGRIAVSVEGTVSSGIVPGRFTLQLANSAGSLNQVLDVTSAGIVHIGGVGGTSGFSNALLEINYNTGQPQSPQGGISHVRITAPDNGFGSYTSETFGTGFSFFTMRAASGTQAAQTALTANHTIGSIAFYSFNGSTYGSVAQIQAFTLNQSSGTDSSGYLVFQTTPSGSLVTTEAGRFQASGGFSVGITTDPGIGSIIANQSVLATFVTANVSMFSPIYYGGQTTTSTVSVFGTNNGSPASGASARLSVASTQPGVFVDFQGHIGLNTLSPATQFHVHLATDQNSIWQTTTIAGAGITISSLNDAVNTFLPMQFTGSKFVFSTAAASGNVLDYGNTNAGYWTTASSGFVFPHGAVNTPPISFTGDLTTGIYAPANGWVAHTQAGQFVFGLPGAQRLTIWQNFPLTFDGGGNAGDSGISRTAAATLAIGNGTAADTTGNLIASSFQAKSYTSSPRTAVGGTSYTMLAGDTSIVINSSGAFTLTLLSAASFTGRWVWLVQKAAFTVTSASSNVVPLNSVTAGTAIMAATGGRFCVLQSDGTNWQIMAAN